MKTHIHFTSGEAYLAAYNETASKFAAAVIHRLGFPEGNREAKGYTKKDDRATPRSVRRAAWDARPIRALSLQDKQDVCQIVQAFCAIHSPNGEKLTAEQVSEIFRECRRTLNMNGGNHDRTRCDELDEAIYYREGGSLASAVKGSTQRNTLATYLRTLRKWLTAAAANDPSRERRRNYHRHAETIRRIAAGANPFSRLNCPVIDPVKTATANESELGKRFSRLRLYCSIPRRLTADDLEGVAESMTAVA
jgi:hypothetical protein